MSPRERVKGGVEALERALRGAYALDHRHPEPAADILASIDEARACIAWFVVKPAETAPEAPKPPRRVR